MVTVDGGILCRCLVWQFSLFLMSAASVIFGDQLQKIETRNRLELLMLQMSSLATKSARGWFLRVLGQKTNESNILRNIWCGIPESKNLQTRVGKS